MTLNSSRQQSHFPTDMDTMHCKSTVGKTSRNFLPVKHISRTSQTSYSSQSDIWQSDWFPTMTAHRSTLWLDNAENRDPSGKQVIQTAPWKGTTSKNRKMSNNGLLTSLANNFYLYKTKQSNSKETHTHTLIYRTCTGQLDIRLLCTWTWLWICVAERCIGNSPCTLYIYTYIQGRDVVKCCKICLLPYHVVMITLVWNTRSQTLPLL